MFLGLVEGGLENLDEGRWFIQGGDAGVRIQYLLQQSGAAAGVPAQESQPSRVVSLFGREKLRPGSNDVPRQSLGKAAGGLGPLVEPWISTLVSVRARTRSLASASRAIASS